MMTVMMMTAIKMTMMMKMDKNVIRVTISGHRMRAV